jgi:hypothetical protein
MLKRLVNGEIAFGFMLATLFWAAALGWLTSYAPTDPEKEACYQSAAKSGRTVDECKAFWEKTTSDPVALFTLVLAASTIGLWGATIGLFLAGKRQITVAQRNVDALINAENAYLFVKIKTETLSKIVATHGRWDKSESMWSGDIETPGLGYFFHNYGRTPALLKEISDQIIVAPSFPQPSEYVTRSKMPEELVIAPGKSSDIFACLMGQTFTVGDAVRFQKRQNAVWFYGYLKFDDAFGRRHQVDYRLCCRRGYGSFRLEYYREWSHDPKDPTDQPPPVPPPQNGQDLSEGSSQPASGGLLPDPF